MNWIKGILILVFSSGFFVLTAGSPHLKLHSTQRYEQCVVGNLSESSMFTDEDRVRMNKIVMETSVLMHKLRLDPTDADNSRTMLRLFTAALANVVADNDSSEWYEREEACISALETCSIALAEATGSELVKEIRKIFASMKNERSYLDDCVDNETPAVSKNNKEYLEKSDQIFSEDLDVKKRPKRAYVTTFGVPATSGQFQTNPSLESILADVLLKSNTFNNIFKTGVKKEDAIFYARGMVAAGLSGYRYDIIDEALDSATNALSMLGYSAGPIDYAYALARSLTSVLTARDLIFYADGLGIGNALVSKLDSMVGYSPALSLPLSAGDSSSSSSWGMASSFASSQTGMATSVQINPGYIEPSTPFNSQSIFQFQNDLYYYLSQSSALSGTFCSGPFPGIYNVINSALFDYGWYIASTAATAVSNSLSGLPTDAACTQYADVISEIISNVFQNNGLLEKANAQEIVNKIAFNVSPNLGIQSNPSDQGFIQQSYSGTAGNVQLNPSFSDYSYPEVQAPVANPQFPVEEKPFFEISLSVPNIQLDSQQFPNQKADVRNPSKFTQDIVKSLIQASAQRSGSVNGTNTKVTENARNSSITADKISGPITNLPKNISTTLLKVNQTSGRLPVILEPGPIISGNPAIGLESTSKRNDSVTPSVLETTKAPDVTTPAPSSTVSYTTLRSVSHPTATPDPYSAAVDRVIEDPSKLSALLMGDIISSLQQMNSTTGNEKKPTNLQIPSKDDKTKTANESNRSKNIPNTPNPTAGSATDTKGKSVQGNTNLQPSFGTTSPTSGPSNGGEKKKPGENFSDSYSTTDLIKNVSLITISSMQYLRSQDFELHELCNMLHDLAFLVNLPPLDYCSEIALVDFLMHVLNAVSLKVMA
ncbi:uncharacterized protein NPIL_621451 [Nephila pilipes]|uniref:Tubuliform egg casing silk strands structural domain-containing protein n=1 Tax=Nephila pilipes TaxID=299642 RepID=A0A8X6Q6L3_NEPPI|nr:uncharacterized protein NPIL_621451 [Nephila pilipes]